MAHYPLWNINPWIEHLLEITRDSCTKNEPKPTTVTVNEQVACTDPQDATTDTVVTPVVNTLPLTWDEAMVGAEAEGKYANTGASHDTNGEERPVMVIAAGQKVARAA
jgi:hypothetical protein